MINNTPMQDRGPYDGAELQRDRSIPPARFNAYDLPSRVGDALYYPDGRVEPVNHAQLPA